MSYRRRPRPARGRAEDAPDPAEDAPDPGHGCADPARCTRPFCAAPVDVHLVAPEDMRVVVREPAGWPLSASALFDRLNEQITREQLLWIAGHDPFGAHLHFPILVRIRLSGQVPANLAFDPGEALRLTRWSSGPDVDHLARAWCCTLLVIAPGDNDDLGDVAAQLAESCLALGGDVPMLAERLLAWRAFTGEPGIARQGGEDHSCGDPVALLALLLLRAATDPDDARLVDLAQTLADAFAAPQQASWQRRAYPRWPTRSVSASHWRRLVDTILTPLRPAHPDLDRLADTLIRARRMR